MKDKIYFNGKEIKDPTQDQWTNEKENLAKEILQMFEIEEVE